MIAPGVCEKSRSGVLFSSMSVWSRVHRASGAEGGQAVGLVAICLVVLIGAAALAIDVGGWYQQSRHAQATADAAALAGAQVLPSDPASAQTLAQQYGASNGGGVDSVTFRSDDASDDTVVVKVAQPALSFFANVFGIGPVTVHAIAAARAEVPGQAFGVAPIVVNIDHPLLSGPGCPCFNQATSLPLGPLGAPGAFGFINLDPGGNFGVPPLVNWIENGYNAYLGFGDYSDVGAKFNSHGISSALADRLGTTLLFPVYDTLTGSGSNAVFHVISWVAFHLTGYHGSGSGSTDSLSGYFTRVIWNGIQPATNQDIPDLGAESVTLVN